MSDFIIDIIEVMFKHLEEGAKVNLKEIEDMIELIDETPDTINKIEDFEHKLRMYKYKQEEKIREELNRACIIDINDNMSIPELKVIKETYEEKGWWDWFVSWIFWK